MSDSNWNRSKLDDFIKKFNSENNENFTSKKKEIEKHIKVFTRRDAEPNKK